jgi:hypothetical protein
MSDTLSNFCRRLDSEWLPAFCAAKRLGPTKFIKQSVDALQELDAERFMRAVDGGLVRREGAFFVAEKSNAREQIFWEGTKAKPLRHLTLWLEPVITIGTLALLHYELGWPSSSLGAQSKDWAFDFLGHGDGEQVLLAGEVKKSVKEVET